MQDPKQTIIDFLSTPLGKPDSPFTLPSDSGLRKGVLRSSGGMGAIATTIHFLKERSIPHHQAHIVTFTDEMGQEWEFTCFLVQEGENWVFKGGSGGSSIPRNREDRQPYANLGGGGAEGGFYAGGRVNSNSLNITHVHLISANGVTLEDTVDDGRVLFLTDKDVRWPMRAELYDGSGHLVGSHTAFNI